MKILYVTTKAGTLSFFVETIRMLVRNGHSVQLACNTLNSRVNPVYNELGLYVHELEYSRSPLDTKNIEATKKLKKIVDNEAFDIVHCHTPVASVCARIACRKGRKKGLKVIYTAHGFHFYKGAPIKNWIIYYPVERLLSRFTDILITINEEDYRFANKHLRAKQIEYVPGVGIDVDYFMNVQINVEQKRKEMGIPEDSFVILSVGEMNENKNHKIVIEAISKIEKNENVFYVIAGGGRGSESLQRLAKELRVNLILLGHRRDVSELYKMADLYTLPSKREGLPVSVMEAMSAGLPIVASRIRGAIDLLQRSDNLLVDPLDADAFAGAIDRMRCSCELRERAGRTNRDRARSYDYRTINDKMRIIYGIE